MKIDRNKGITSITYNHLNLPEQVNFGSDNIKYVYDATGMKQRKIVSMGTTTDYANGYLYENDDLKFFGHPEGYVEPDGLGGFDYVYQYKDHLGNVRLSYTDADGNGSIDASTEIISEKNYYPFGLEHKGYNNVVNGTENNYFNYNGKELEKSLGLDWLDLGARMYDPAIARFNTIDPMVDFVNHQSPYAMANNNPVANVDEYGLGILNVIGNLFRRAKRGVKRLFKGKECNCKSIESIAKAFENPDFIRRGKRGGGKPSRPKPTSTPPQRRAGTNTEGIAAIGGLNIGTPDLDIPLETPSIPELEGRPITTRLSVPTFINFSGKDGTVLDSDDNVNNRTLNAIVKTLQDYPQLKMFMYVNKLQKDFGKGADFNIEAEEEKYKGHVSKRAASIIKFLQRNGIDPNRIKWGFDSVRDADDEKAPGKIGTQRFILINND